MVKRVRPDSPPKFAGELATPIVIPFHPLPLGDLEQDTSRTIEASMAVVAPLQMRKMLLLLDHYGIPHDHAADTRWLLLAMRLATDFVPGFKIVFDDPMAKEARLPFIEGPRANRIGSGKLPWLVGARLLELVKLMKTLGADEGRWQGDAACARQIYEDMWPKVRKRPTNAEREGAIRTIKRRITAARRRIEGAATMTRSRTDGV